MRKADTSQHKNPSPSSPRLNPLCASGKNRANAPDMQKDTRPLCLAIVLCCNGTIHTCVCF